MTICRICGRDDGHHHDHDEHFICARCYAIVEPIVECRIAYLQREYRATNAVSKHSIKSPPHEPKVYVEIIEPDGHTLP